MSAKKHIRKQVGFKLKPSAKMGFMLALALYSSFGSMQHAVALPTGEAVAAGAATFVRDGNSLRIDQSTQQAIVNWQSFSIAADEAVNLYQPSHGLALFRILGSDSSQIFGSLTATGSLFLSNPNGILFAPGAQVDVGSLVATTMRISDQDFLSNQFKFFSDSNAKVMNQGVIRTGDGGYLVLLAEQVENSGTLMANRGSVVLGSAQSAVLDMFGDGLVKVNLSGEALNAVIAQTGKIQADAGQVQIATSARSAAINVTGVVQANSLVERNGIIRLEGGSGSKVAVNGTLQAVGNENGMTGGEIIVSGEQVALLSNANIDASGQAGGGNVLVGGDYQGKNAAVFNARTTYVAQDANILANARSEGDGGKVVVWADDTTRYYGNISAQGGELAGNGGFVEVSGKRQLDFGGKVNVSAANGLGGQVLLDPENIILSTAAGAVVNQPDGTPDIAFADPPAIGTTNVQISGVTGFSELFLQATNDISIVNALTMAANGSIRLEANNDINVNAAITTSGTGFINLKADADANGVGNLAIGGNITSRAGGIELSGATITRTAGNIASTGAANQKAGDINISATGIINLGAASITATGGNGSPGNPGAHGGNISISGNGITGTGAITANGGNGNGTNQAGGNAGTINIQNLSAGNISVGNLAARTGNATGTGAGGTAGSVAVNNLALNGNVTTGTITTTGGNNGAGSNIDISSQTGALSVGTIAASGGNATTNSSGRNAGNVRLSSAGTLNTLAITAIGTNRNGSGTDGGNGGNVDLTGTVITTRSINTTGGNANGGVSGNGGNITLTGNTLLDANTTMSAMGGNTGVGTGGNILFDGTLDASGGNRTLAINSNGSTTFNAAVGSLPAFGFSALTTNAGGTTFINGGSVSTLGSQTYGNAVSLGNATTLTTSNANTNLVFTGPVNANGNDLTMNIVRDITANNLSNDFATVAINAGRNVSLRDANAINFSNSSVGGTLNVGTSGNITQSGTVSVTGVTTLAAGAANNITLDNTNNDFSSVTITNGNQVTVVDQNALTINASTVGSLFARTLSGNLTLAGNVSASGTGDAIQLIAAENFINSGNRTLTTPNGRWLVFSTNPDLDTRGANLLIAHDFKQYNASFGDPILGSNDGFIYSIAPTINVDLTGTANKIYDGTLDAPTAGLTASNPTGAIDGDIITLGAVTSASFADKNAGINKPVTGTVEIASAANGVKPVYGYQTGTVNSTATGTIAQRPISVIVNPGQNKLVGQPDPIFTFSVGDMGLAMGETLLDAFTGALARAPGELAGLYAINQGSLLATSNYTLSSFTGSDFTIVALPPAPPPEQSPVVDNGNLPRNAASLVDANPQLTSYTNPQLVVLNLSPTAAGGDESEGNLSDCEADTQQADNNPDASIMLNFGMALPEGVQSSCI